MALILARSPYFASRGSFDSGATLLVTISYIDDNVDNVVLKTYSLNFFSQQYIDISPLIRDYLDERYTLRVVTIVSGSIGGSTQTDVALLHNAVDGYGYYEDGFNPDLSQELIGKAYYAGSNSVIYRNNDESVRIPLLNPRTTASGLSSEPFTSVKFYQSTTLMHTFNTNFQYDSTEDLYVSDSHIDYAYQGISPTSYLKRVLTDGGVVESKNCSNIYDELYEAAPPNRVVITPDRDTTRAYELTIVPVSECKETPHRLVFLNRFGVKEDLWFFKKSKETLNVSKESYKANTLNAFASGDFSKHSYSNFNLNGRRSMSLNSGFVPESFKENFKQLMLSEKVWINIDGKELPISIKNSELELKKSLNDKLINYTIEVEFSYDTINNIG